MLIPMFKTVWKMNLIARIGLVGGGIGVLSGLISLVSSILVIMHILRAEDVREYAAQMLLISELLLVFCIVLVFAAERYKQRDMI